MEGKVLEIPRIKADDQRILKDLFRAISHTIFYHRTLGPVQSPEIEQCVVLKTSFVKCGDEEISNDIEKKLAGLLESIKKNQGKGTYNITIELVEKKKDKMFFINTESEKSIEKWQIPCEISNMPFENESKDIKLDTINRAEKYLFETIIKILEFANLNCENIPNILQSSNEKTMPYQYKFNVEEIAKSNYSIYNFFKK